MTTRLTTSCCWQELLYRTTSRSCFTCSTSSRPIASSTTSFIKYCSCLPLTTVIKLREEWLSLSLCAVTLRASWRSSPTSPKRTRSRSCTTCWGLTCCGGSRPTCSRTCPLRPSWSSEWSWAQCRSTLQTNNHFLSVRTRLSQYRSLSQVQAVRERIFCITGKRDSFSRECTHLFFLAFLLY